MRLAGLALALALAAWPLAAGAQTTAITPDAGALSLGTTAARAGNLVTIDGGTLAGSNLFHSFTQFSLAAGDTAQWVRSAGGGAGVSNVINRVTGGQVSQIAGTLDSSQLPNANFYFINPAGVVFSASAHVNVPAAAYFSTAGELRFADATKFAIATPGGSTLSIAAPQSFGFVGGQGAISINGVAQDFAPPPAALSFAASDIQVANAHLLQRGLDLTAVGLGAAQVSLLDPTTTPSSAGAVTLSASQLIVSPTGAAAGPLRITGGAVTLDAAMLISSTAGAAKGGDLLIRAGQLKLVNAPSLTSVTQGGGAGGAISVQAGDIDGEGGQLTTTAFGANTGPGGPVTILGDTVALHGVTLGSNTTGAGVGGDLTLSATKSMLLDASFVVANSLASGGGGQISVSAPSLTLSGAIASTTANGAGRPGDVTVRGDHIAISTGLLGSAPGLGNDSGNLTITATSDVTVTNGFFSAATSSTGAAGVISVTAPRVTMTGSFIDTDAFGDGGVGSVIVQGQTLAFSNDQVIAQSHGAFASRLGRVQFSATGDLSVVGGQIASNAFGGASGGVIVLSGRSVTVDGAMVQSDTSGGGAGGQVTLSGGAISVQNGAAISSNAFAGGAAGDVTLAGGDVTLGSGATVSSDTFGSGAGGRVALSGGAILLQGGAMVTSVADAGTGAAGSVTVNSSSLTLRDASIASDTSSSGAAGSVAIVTGDLTLQGLNRGNTFISSDSLGTGDAGAVTIQARNLSADGGAVISSSSLPGASGRSGVLTLNTDSVTLRSGALIATASSNRTPAGQINLTTGTFVADGDETGLDSENSAGLGSRRPVGGDAGTIRVFAHSLTVENGARISTDSFAGAAGDIEISMPAGTILKLTGATAPGSIDTSSGAGTGGRIVIGTPLAVVLNGGSILALGQQRGANVLLQSTYFVDSVDRPNTVAVDGEFKIVAGLYDLSSGAVSRDLSVLDASKVMRGQCPAARSTGQVSQLITRPVGPYVRDGAPTVPSASAPPRGPGGGDCR
ncbi:filamentous hemagglutinin N-terminal domain-containing protein [Phenylobacterium sp.]|uniref:beta strand repeat-containing protein n=1 Tax=Phenylobacterium sp. TaxID=1871053 RepID=UPI002CFA1B70|nr:filamentous hemagglutinin N-terminal domain-containing protein [Phenylobacterium sp.]HLZ77445.1 filamentous hemagglutinin N-terminal domain-containing protein [Phenylobacterium sp.]